jgi:hypothetical protein
VTYVGSEASQKRKKSFSTFSSLHNINYRYLWIGNLFNTGGLWIQQVTIGWLVWELSGSAALVGIAAGLRFVPFIFLGPLGGVAADRMDRRRLLMITQTVMAVAAVMFAVVVALDWVRVWHAMVFSFVMGCGFTLNMPVRQSLIANTVPIEELGNAIALNATAVNASRIIGPAAGGVLIVAFGAAGNFLLQAGLYLCMVAVIFPMKAPYRDGTPMSKASAFRSLKEGVHYVWGNKTLFGLVILSFIPSLFVMPILQIMPIFTEKVLHAKADVYGYLMDGNRGAVERRHHGHPFIPIRPALDCVSPACSCRLFHNDLQGQQQYPCADTGARCPPRAHHVHLPARPRPYAAFLLCPWSRCGLLFRTYCHGGVGCAGVGGDGRADGKRETDTGVAKIVETEPMERRYGRGTHEKIPVIFKRQHPQGY